MLKAQTKLNKAIIKLLKILSDVFISCGYNDIIFFVKS